METYAIQILKGLPHWSQIILALIVIMVLLPSKVTKFINPIYAFLYRWKLGNRVEQSDLINSSLFIKEKHYKRIISIQHYGDDDRNFIFRTLLDKKVDAILQIAKELATLKNINKVNLEEFKLYLVQSPNKIVMKYNKDILDSYCEKYGVCFGPQLFKLIMDDPNTGFNQLHETIVNQCEIYGEKLCTIKALRTNSERADLMIEQYNTAAYQSIIDTEDHYQIYNGRLTKLLEEYYNSKKL